MAAPILRIPDVSHVLAVASGKGGVGKTTVAVNLALALRQGGARVGLFDADLYGPNVPLMLGVRRKRSAQGLVPVGRADSTPYISPLERFGLKVMSMGFVMGDADAVTPDPFFAGHIIRQTLQDVLWGELDFLLLDLPPGTGEPQQTLLNTIHVDGILIVTTPQDLSLMDTSRALGLFRRANVPVLGVIENMSYLNCPRCGEPIEVFCRSERRWAVEDRDLTQLGRVPMDIAISRGIDAGHPLVQAVPNAPEAMIFRDIAAEITRKLMEKSTLWSLVESEDLGSEEICYLNLTQSMASWSYATASSWLPCGWPWTGAAPSFALFTCGVPGVGWGWSSLLNPHRVAWTTGPTPISAQPSVR